MLCEFADGDLAVFIVQLGKGGSFGSSEGCLGPDGDSLSHIADDDGVGLHERGGRRDSDGRVNNG